MDVYRIGVTIAMVNNASAVLGVIQKDVLGLNKSVEATALGFNKATVAVAGLASVLAGGVILGVMAKMVAHGKDLVHQQALFAEQFRDMQGMTPDKLMADTAEATRQAWKTTADVVTSNVSDNLRSIRELVTVFGDLETAKTNLTVVTKAQSVMDSVRGKGAGDQVFDMAKALEIKGVSMDPAHFAVLLDDMVKAAIASGGRVLGSDYLQSFKYGRTATQGWNDEFVATILPTLIQEMKGGGSGGRSGPGNALMSAFAAIVGGTMSNKAAEEFDHLHLIAPHAIIRTKTGHVKGIRPGGILGSSEFQANPFAWVQDILVPALKKAGITDPDKVREEIAHLFSNRTSQQVMTMFATQQMRFEKDAKLNRGAAGVGAYDTLIQNDPAAKIKAFEEAWKNMLTALGSPLVDDATNLLAEMAAAMRNFTAWAVTHKELVKAIEETIATLGALAVAAGVFAIGGAAAAALGVLSGPVGLMALAAGMESLSKSLPGVTKWIDDLSATITKDLGPIGKVLGWGAAELNKATGAGPVATHGTFYTAAGNAVKWAEEKTGILRPDQVPSYGTATQPLYVHITGGQMNTNVTNLNDLGASVGHGITSSVSRPPTGPSGFDTRMSLPAPGQGIPQ